MKVSFVIPDETLDAAVALFAMKCKKAEEKAELNEALAKAKQADVVEVPRDFLYDNSDDAVLSEGGEAANWAADDSAENDVAFYINKYNQIKNTFNR